VRGGVPGQGVGMEGVKKRQISPQASPMDKAQKTGCFPHLLKTSKTPFYTKLLNKINIKTFFEA
jgi:hypothetical protein